MKENINKWTNHFRGRGQLHLDTFDIRREPFESYNDSELSITLNVIKSTSTQPPILVCDNDATFEST